MGSDFHSNRLAAKASVMDSHGSRLRIQSPRTISTYELSDLPTTRAPYSRATLPVPSQDPWSTTSSSSHGNSISSARPMRNASLCVCNSAVILGMAATVYAKYRLGAVVKLHFTSLAKSHLTATAERSGAPPTFDLRHRPEA